LPTIKVFQGFAESFHVEKHGADNPMYRMQRRNEYSRNGAQSFESRFQDEPKVIAVSATRQQFPATMALVLGAAMVAYAWLSLLQLG
jgi:hypothetical protein